MSKQVVSLKQMAEGKEEGVQKATYFKVDPKRVEFEDGFNLREEGPELDAHIEALYVSMKAGAYVPPIDVSVVDGRIIVRDGHCRTRAARRIVDDGGEYLLEARQYRGNEADCVLHMLSSAQGKSFSPLEAGRGFLRLTRYGLTVPMIKDRTGLHPSTIYNGLLLAEAPVEIQMLINGGAVSCQVALEAIREHGSEAAAHLRKLVQKASNDGVTKVTKKHSSSPRVPAAAALTMVKSIHRVRQQIEDELQLVESLDNFDENSTVQVPAVFMRDLMAQFDAMKLKLDDGGEL